MACQLPGFSLLNWSTRRALGQHSSKGSAKRIQGAKAVGIGEPNPQERHQKKWGNVMALTTV